MFMLMESLRSALESIAAHAFRSALTTLGIAIGASSVVAVIALMQGMQTSITTERDELGGNNLSVRAKAPVDFQAALAGDIPRLTPADLELLVDRVDGIESITPLAALGGGFEEIRAGSRAAFGSLFGTTHSYQDVYDSFPAVGRFLSPADELRRRLVCVLGDGIRQALGLPEDPVGAFVQIGGEWVKVVGVMEPRGSFFGLSQDDYALIPYSTLRRISGAPEEIGLAIELAVASGVDRDAVAYRIRGLLRLAHGLAPGEEDDFEVESSERMGEAFERIGTVLTIVVAGVVGISLLVGGIGIMNIMLVSVTERTREIGTLKALGATRRQILLQFLTEAAALSVLGGVIGLAVGYGAGATISALLPDFPAAVVPLWGVALAVGFSALVGIVFGIMPAYKAADLHPIEALRYE